MNTPPKRRKISPLWVGGGVLVVAAVTVSVMFAEASRQRGIIKDLERRGAEIEYIEDEPWLPDLLNTARLRRVTSISLHERPINSFNGISQCTNLTELSVTGNSYFAYDLAPLVALTRLEHLRLTVVKSDDCSFLAALTQLRFLSLAGSDVNDLSFLRSMGKLTYLDLTDCPVADLSPTIGLPLSSLDISRTKVTDLESVGNLPNLIRFRAVGCEIHDLTPLNKLKQLTVIEMADSKVSNLEPLAGIATLTHIDLPQTNISDIGPVARMPSLLMLNLNETQVTDLTPLMGSKNLTYLSIANTPVQDLAPLVSVRTLNTLDISSTKVVDLSPMLKWRPVNPISSTDTGTPQITIELHDYRLGIIAGGTETPREQWEQLRRSGQRIVIVEKEDDPELRW